MRSRFNPFSVYDNTKSEYRRAYRFLREWRSNRIRVIQTICWILVIQGPCNSRLDIVGQFGCPSSPSQQLGVRSAISDSGQWAANLIFSCVLTSDYTCSFESPQGDHRRDKPRPGIYLTGWLWADYRSITGEGREVVSEVCRSGYQSPQHPEANNCHAGVYHESVSAYAMP